MDLKRILLITSIFILPIIVSGDFNIDEYKFYKELKLEQSSNYFEIDEDIFLASPVTINNIKIIENKKKEIPYEIKKDEDYINHHYSNKTIKIISQVKKNNFLIEYLLDLENNFTYHNKIQVLSSADDYFGQVDIFGANNIEGPYEKLNRDFEKKEIFSVTPGKNDPSIEYKFNNYRYLKLKIYFNNSDFLIDKFLQNFDEVDIKKGERRYNEVNISRKSIADQDIFILNLEKTGIFVEKLKIDFVEGIFKRKYSLWSANSLKTDNWKKISAGELYRNNYDNNLTLDVFDNKKYYKLIINNSNSSELHLFSAYFESFSEKVYFPNNLDFIHNEYRVYYGNSNINIPHYSFRIKKNNILDKKAKLGPQKKNELFKQQSKKYLKNNYNKIIIFIIIFIFFFLFFWFLWKILVEVKNKRKKGWTKEEINSLNKKK